MLILALYCIILLCLSSSAVVTDFGVVALCAVPCSLTPTFAAIAMFINNHRWDGVPFLLKAGKALHKRCAEIRVQFRCVWGGGEGAWSAYCNTVGKEAARHVLRT